ncbi:MAG: PAS domain-containing protein [Burkholderiales bacterium]
MSLNSYLTRLIWLCMLPPVLLATYLAVDRVHNVQAERDLAAAGIAGSVASAADQHLRARIGALRTLAASPLASDASRRKDFYLEALAFHDSFGSHVILADLGMQMLFNTRVPLGAALPVLPRPKGRSAVSTALETGAPAVGDIFPGPIAKEPLVAIAVPVRREEKTAFLLLTIFETAQFQKHLEQVALPPGWSIALLDSNGAAIARRAQPASGTAGTNEAGFRKFVVKSAASPWSATLEIPADVYRAPVITMILKMTLVVLLVVISGGLGGSLASRWLARSVASLTQVPASGAPLPRIAEIAAARRMLDETAEKRATVEAALRESAAETRRLLLVAEKSRAALLSILEDQRRAEKTLSESKQQLQFVTDHAPVLIAHCDRDRRYKFANRQYAEMFGRQPTEVVGRHAREVLGEEAYSHASPYMGLALAGKPVTYDLALQAASGKPLVVQASYLPEHDASGQVVGFVAAILDITARKQAEERLRDLSRRMMNIEEAERKAISRELHDRLGQNLAGLNLLLNIVRSQLPADVRQAMGAHLDNACKLAEESIAQVRNVMAELRPPALDDYGLLAALRIHAESFSAHTGIQVAVRGGEIVPRLSPAVEIALFRIAQEALNNVAKHAQARHADILLGKRDGRVYLEISDDGAGLEQKPDIGSQPSWGFAIMRERAQAIGAALRIESAPGAGTRVIVTLDRKP